MNITFTPAKAAPPAGPTFTTSGINGITPKSMSEAQIQTVQGIFKAFQEKLVANCKTGSESTLDNITEMNFKSGMIIGSVGGKPRYVHVSVLDTELQAEYQKTQSILQEEFQCKKEKLNPKILDPNPSTSPVLNTQRTAPRGWVRPSLDLSTLGLNTWFSNKADARFEYYSQQTDSNGAGLKRDGKDPVYIHDEALQFFDKETRNLESKYASVWCSDPNDLSIQRKIAEEARDRAAEFVVFLGGSNGDRLHLYYEVTSLGALTNDLDDRLMHTRFEKAMQSKNPVAIPTAPPKSLHQQVDGFVARLFAGFRRSNQSGAAHEGSESISVSTRSSSSSDSSIEDEFRPAFIKHANRASIEGCLFARDLMNSSFEQLCENPETVRKDFRKAAQAKTDQALRDVWNEHMLLEPDSLTEEQFITLVQHYRTNPQPYNDDSIMGAILGPYKDPPLEEKKAGGWPMPVEGVENDLANPWIALKGDAGIPLSRMCDIVGAEGGWDSSKGDGSAMVGSMGSSSVEPKAVTIEEMLAAGGALTGGAPPAAVPDASSITGQRAQKTRMLESFKQIEAHKKVLYAQLLKGIRNNPAFLPLMIEYLSQQGLSENHLDFIETDLELLFGKAQTRAKPGLTEEQCHILKELGKYNPYEKIKSQFDVQAQAAEFFQWEPQSNGDFMKEACLIAPSIIRFADQSLQKDVEFNEQISLQDRGRKIEAKKALLGSLVTEKDRRDPVLCYSLLKQFANESSTQQYIENLFDFEALRVSKTYRGPIQLSEEQKEIINQLHANQFTNVEIPKASDIRRADAEAGGRHGAAALDDGVSFSGSAKDITTLANLQLNQLNCTESEFDKAFVYETGGIFSWLHSPKHRQGTDLMDSETMIKEVRKKGLTSVFPDNSNLVDALRGQTVLGSLRSNSPLKFKLYQADLDRQNQLETEF